jgi:hypothetical protein
MANITDIEPIRYGQHGLSSDTSGMIVVPPNLGLDCSAADTVNGFTLAGAEPEGTARRVGFTVDGALCKLDASGGLVPIADAAGEGNTVGELAALSSIPAFAGRQIGVTVWLYAPDPDGEKPSLGLSVKAESSSIQTVKTELSPVYELGSGSKIIRLDAAASTANGGTAVVEARVDGGAWGALPSFTGLPASSVQFRVTLTAPNVGTSSAALDRATITYRSGSSAVSGVGVSEIISITEDWHIGVRECRLTVRHARLTDAAIKAYAAFRAIPAAVLGENAGIGDGETKSFNLANTQGIRLDSVRVYFDGARAYSGIEVNTETGRVTCAAPAGALVTVDYEYGWDSGVWNGMEPIRTIPSLGYDETEYRYVRPSGTPPASVVAVKIALETTGGHIGDEGIGAGTGSLKTYPLTRAVKNGAISVSADEIGLPASAFSLSDDAKSVRVSAPAGAVLTAAYDWISETPTVHRFVAVFGE